MIDVLNLEWTSNTSRDRQIATLVCNYLRYMGYNVIEGSIFNGYYLINKYKPKVFFITNTIGAKINHKTIKYAKDKNIRCISLISEGNFLEGRENIEQFVWGWNKEKKMYEDINLQWSERTKKMTIKYYPELKDKIKISGGVGFDIYKISNYKKNFMQKYNKSNFKKIIGIGLWDFGIFYPEDNRYDFYKEIYSTKVINRFKKDQKDFNKILLEIIRKNENILFLLKEHPGVQLNRQTLGISEFEVLKNVLIIKNEESIIDCINISDFWLVYESTTAMEAWLLNKQTCLLNPSGINFPRDVIYKGSPFFTDVISLQKAIDHYYLKGDLPGFRELEYYRTKLIKNIIQWDDGLNHVRAGNEIINLLKNNDIGKIKNDNLNQAINRYKQIIKWKLSPYLFFLPIFKNYKERRKSFNHIELNRLSKKRYEEQIRFYNRNNLNKKKLVEIRCIA